MLRTFLGRAPRIHPSAFIHDSAEVVGDVSVGPKASVWPLCVLRGDIEPIRIGAESNIQDLAVIHTRSRFPAAIGRRVSVGHRAVLHGCRVGDGCLIGMGAVVLEAVVGAESLIGAGATVLGGMRIPPGSLVLGTPAKVVRKLKPSELREIRRTVAGYLRLALGHRRTSRVVFPA